ncbi:MAG: hypothetical protein QOE03_325 [Micromonosporaceae bacterium]|nr:hypothetical protein [Micromonosporaceae bacterium]
MTLRPPGGPRHPGLGWVAGVLPGSVGRGIDGVAGPRTGNGIACMLFTGFRAGL